MSEQKEFRRKTRLMGSSFEFILVTDSDSGEELLQDCIREVKRIEDLLTEFNEFSQTSKINRAAGNQAVKVDPEVYELIRRCIRISKLTQGAFDITAGSLRRLYNYKSEHFVWPANHQIQACISLVGHDKIKLLPDNHVFLEKEKMSIGFGAIGKGYAADRVKDLMKQKGVTSGVINASGDLTVWGKRIDGSSWKIGIANPAEKSKIISWLPLQDNAVATSGDYEQYVEENGIRHSHIIDPKSGKPLTGMQSVTVVGPSAELVDALATAISIMGVDIGMHLVNQLPSTHCLVVKNNHEVFVSRKLKISKNELAEIF